MISENENVNNSLRIASLNIDRGLFNKEEKLINTIEELELDIFGVSEVDIKDFDEKKPFSLEGFNTFFPLQRPGTNTKRILCFTKANIEVKQRDDLMSSLLSNIWLEIQGKGHKILICVIYREFNDLTGNGKMGENEETERLQVLHSQVEKASKEGTLLMLGDMNIDLDKMEEEKYYQAKQAKEYQTMISENGLDVIHFGKTFKRPNREESALDHALTNKPEQIKDYQKIEIKYSDHDLIYVDLNVKVTRLKDFKNITRDYRKVRSNPNFLVNKLTEIGWESLKDMPNVKDMVQFWTSELNKCLDVTAPWKSRKNRKKKFRLPMEVQSAIKKQNELQKEHQKNVKNGTPDTTLERTFKKQRNFTNSLIKKAVREKAGRNISNESTMKQIWDSINDIIRPERNAKNFLKIETKEGTYEDPLQVAEEFVTFFKEKIEKLEANINKNPNIDPLSELKKKLKHSNLKFSLKTVKEKEVLKLLKALKRKKSYGPDGITSEILKIGAEVLAAPLTWIINTSITTGEFPEEWKIAKIIPLFKKGNRRMMKNYRPVSLLSVAGMILEKIIAIQIEEFFEKNKLFGSFQFGFRKDKSTVSELLTLFDILLDAKQDKKEIILIMYDLSSAFDLADHKILLAKLKVYGFDSNALKWVESYLKNRKQFVTVEGKMSKTIDINTGVPQGSRLSPLLFICLMADLDLWTKESMITNFADDTQSVIIKDGRDEAVDTAKKEANSVIEFFENNNFVNNSDKAAVLYNSGGQGTSITIEGIGGETIASNESEKSEKLLGLHINSSFNWNSHIEELVIVLKKRIGLLKRIKKRVPKDKLIIIAESIFNSKIRYGIAVYLKPTFDREEVKTEKLSKHTKELQVVQNSMIRVIRGLKQADHINMRKVRKQINMLSVNQMSVYHTAMEAYNITNRTSSEQLQEKLIRHEGRHSERSAANNELYVPKEPRIQCTGFSYLGPKLYNMLTAEIKNAKSMDDFKSKLMEWIWKNIH